MTPPGPFRAVIFDMDGVLTDSEPSFHAAVNDILARYNEHIELADYAAFIGVQTHVMWDGMRKLKRIDTPVDELVEIYEAPLMKRLREPRDPLPGARPLLEKLRAARVPVAVCTASYTRWADAILGGAGLLGLYDAISTADMVERSKPDPAPYLHAASLLAVQPQECIAVEDSASGVASALGAGMYVIQLRATATAAPAVDGVARVITSLAEFPSELLAPR